MFSIMERINPDDVVWSSSPGGGTSRRPRSVALLVMGAKYVILDCVVFVTLILRSDELQYYVLHVYHAMDWWRSGLDVGLEIARSFDFWSGRSCIMLLIPLCTCHQAVTLCCWEGNRMFDRALQNSVV